MCYRVLSTCYFCLWLAACNGQEQIDAINQTTEVITKSTEVITVPEQTTEKTSQHKPRSELKLSIDEISIDKDNDDNIFSIDKKLIETNSDTFKTLTRDRAEPDFNLSGKLFTDEEKIENKEYLDSINGLQINIEGSFR